MTLSDVICKWYTGAVIGFFIGKNLHETLGSLAGLAIGAGIGWALQKKRKCRN